MRSERLAHLRGVIIISIVVVVYKIDFHRLFPPNNILPLFKLSENIGLLKITTGKFICFFGYIWPSKEI